MAETASPTKRQRWTKWLLIASLGLNLFVLGTALGMVWSGGPRRAGPMGERSLSAPYVDALSREDKRALRHQMRGQLPNHKERRAQNVADYQAFLAILRAEDFDVGAASVIMERQMGRANETVQMGRHMTIARIAEMDAGTRQAYADRLEERLSRRSKRAPRIKPQERD